MFLFKKNKINQLRSDSGFSLFETLVTIFIFSIIFMVISGAFVASLRVQRRAINLQAIEENVNFAFESMAKEIRVSSQIITPDTANCSTPTASLEFDHPVNGRIIYSLNGTAIQRSDDGVASSITSNTIEVTRFGFCISGSAIDDTRQPRITLVASVRSKKVSQQTTIDFQTTLSQRFLSN